MRQQFLQTLYGDVARIPRLNVGQNAFELNRECTDFTLVAGVDKDLPQSIDLCQRLLKFLLAVQP